MSTGIMQDLADCYHSRHYLVLKLVDNLNDRQLIWRMNRTTPPIAFHVWHLARWADYLQEILSGGGDQIWDQEDLAEKWCFDEVNLGFGQTGLSMDNSDVDSLPFPRKEILLDYARRAFIRADMVISTFNDEHIYRKVIDPHGVEGEELTIVDAVLNWMMHASRHLGMIECLLGAQGLQGSATR
jgi:hypothetical protein